MWVLETVAVAFGMYSALPVPRVEWNEKNMRYALLAFPLVGAVLGLAWCGAAALCAALGLPDVLRGAALCALPVVVTGGIHLDGYADTCDALASHASPTPTPATRWRVMQAPCASRRSCATPIAARSR